MSTLTCLLIISALTMCGTRKEPPANPRPIDEKATAETAELYERLFRLRDKGIMVGHQDALAYGHGWYGEEGRSDMKDVTGEYPAVVGWELGQIETGAGYNLDSVYFSDMKRYIKETYLREGITTVSWHGNNIVTGNTSWDCGQDYVVGSVLPGGVNHEEFKCWLDRLADFFLSLKDDSGKAIPVVFRMYHEHTGAWFWWGSRQCTPEEYKKLWIMTVDYLREQRDVHNLLYAYSPSELTDEAHLLERYPGDDYVDIIGFDCYAGGSDPAAVKDYMAAMAHNLDIVTSYAEKSAKLPIIGETGMESVPYSEYFTRAVYPVVSRYKIGWVLFWRNAWESDKTDHFYLPYKGHPAGEDLRNFISREDILVSRDITKVM